MDRVVLEREKPPKRGLTLVLPPRLYVELKAICKILGIPMKNAICKELVRWIEGEEEALWPGRGVMVVYWIPEGFYNRFAEMCRRVRLGKNAATLYVVTRWVERMKREIGEEKVLKVMEELRREAPTWAVLEHLKDSRSRSSLQPQKR